MNSVKNILIIFSIFLVSCGGGSSSGGGPSKNVTAECLKTSTKAADNGIPLINVTLENKCNFAISAGFVAITFKGPFALRPKQTRVESTLPNPVSTLLVDHHQWPNKKEIYPNVSLRCS